MPSQLHPSAAPPRPVVFLPCGTLDEFPTWLDDREADELLAAWTAAWHPRLVAAGGPPRWASVDLPAPSGLLVGIVPRSWDDRFAAQFDAAAAADVQFVRATDGRAAIAAAALAAAGEPFPGPTADAWVADFQALGLAVLLAEVLARRMRTEAGLETTGFDAAVAAAAAAAVAGDDAAARDALAECFRCLEASRARYYPVDVWLLDLVLMSPATSATTLGAELAAPVPIGLVATGRDVAALAARAPEAAAALAGAIADGRVCPCGGPIEDRPLDACLPEELAASFAAGAAAWEAAAGRRPPVFARHGGGGSAILPALLAGLGFEGAVWGTFDGAPLPNPGSGRLCWEGTGAATIEAVARPPLDARGAASVLALPDRLSDVMDHDHVAAVMFAHHAGTASEWHELLRRIGRQSTVFGTFVAPDELFRRTAGAATTLTLGPDEFPPTRLPPDAAALDAAVDAATTAAGEAVARAEALRPVVASAVSPCVRPAPPPPASRGVAAAVAGWWTGSWRDDPDLVLAGEDIRAVVHPETGGILALRRAGSGPNRLSQQLAIRGPRGHGRMLADEVGRGTTASGASGIVSRGRLVAADGRDAGTFVQGLSLVPGSPLIVLDVEVAVTGQDVGRLVDDHVACRCAWHENEDVVIRRGVHGQAVVTERTRFTAPHFVEIVPAGPRGAAADAVTILTGGLPWHTRSTPHVLDTILAGPTGTTRRRLALGIGLERPWDAALELLAGVTPGSGPRPGPPNVRVTVQDVEVRDGRVARARVGLCESGGVAGRVRVEWARDIAAAAPRELDGRPRAGVDVTIEGRAVVVFLRAWEWLLVDLEFGA